MLVNEFGRFKMLFLAKPVNGTKGKQKSKVKTGKINKNLCPPSME